MSGSGPEWKQLSLQLLVSLHSTLWDEAGGTLWEEASSVVGLLSFVNESLAYKPGLQSWLPGLYTGCACVHADLLACLSVCLCGSVCLCLCLCLCVSVLKQGPL